MENQPQYQRFLTTSRRDNYKEGLSMRDFLHERGFIVKDMKDDVPEFYN